MFVFLVLLFVEQSDTIGYDPYASKEEEQAKKARARQEKTVMAGPAAPDPMTQIRGMLAAIRGESTESEKPRGTCTKCGGVGHLAFQCFNTIKLKPRKPAPVVSAPTLAQVSSSTSGSSSAHDSCSHRKHHSSSGSSSGSSTDSSDSGSSNSSASLSPGRKDSDSERESRSKHHHKHHHHHHHKRPRHKHHHHKTHARKSSSSSSSD